MSLERRLEKAGFAAKQEETLTGFELARHQKRKSEVLSNLSEYLSGKYSIESPEHSAFVYEATPMGDHFIGNELKPIIIQLTAQKDADLVALEIRTPNQKEHPNYYDSTNSNLIDVLEFSLSHPDTKWAHHNLFEFDGLLSEVLATEQGSLPHTEAA